VDGGTRIGTRGAHPRRRTWSHGCGLSMAARRGESGEEVRPKREGKGRVRWRLTAGPHLSASRASEEGLTRRREVKADGPQGGAARLGERFRVVLGTWPARAWPRLGSRFSLLN
jgi:hypothetical protein